MACLPACSCFVTLRLRTLGKGEEVYEATFQFECTAANLARIEAQFLIVIETIESAVHHLQEFIGSGVVLWCRQFFHMFEARAHRQPSVVFQLLLVGLEVA
jgi:hypothetical protein